MWNPYSSTRHLASKSHLLSIGKFRCDNVAKNVCTRLCSTEPKHQETKMEISSETLNKLDVFDEMVAFRRKQARASVVVEVMSPKSAALVHHACSKHGTVEKMFHYTYREKELILVELDSEGSTASLLESCSHNDSIKVIPTLSPFLWLRSMPNSIPTILTAPEIIHENDTDDSTILEKMSQCDSMSEQIETLEHHSRLSESSHRLRWLTCTQVERTMSGLFSNLMVYPFGSSINGCGRNGCDLDMVVSFTGNNKLDRLTDTPRSPLVFHAKAALVNSHLQTQRQIATFADILQNFTTGITQVQRVLSARVPILKFHHEFTGIDCDLSMSSLSGLYMSEILFLFGEMDSRFRPLVNAVRYWGSVSRLTRSTPAPCPNITNFSLTLLVVFYLQNCKPSILPTLNEMMRAARPELDRRLMNDTEFTFLRDPTMFKERCRHNQESLEDLFIGFLHFIESFPFPDKSISIITGQSKRRAVDMWPLFIQNPLEPMLNVSRNVNVQEVTRLGMEARNALFQLDNRESQGDSWGLLSLLSSTSKDLKIKRAFHAAQHSPKDASFMLNFEDLLHSESDENGSVKSNSSPSESPKNHKNPSTKMAINDVRQRTNKPMSRRNSSNSSKAASIAHIVKSRWK